LVGALFNNSNYEEPLTQIDAGSAVRERLKVLHQNPDKIRRYGHEDER
jgi:hypothetical protein